MLLAALVLATHMDCCLAPPQPGEIEAARAHSEKAASELRRYALSHNFDVLSDAVFDVQAMLSYGVITRGNFIGYRRTLVQRWAYIISELQKHYDPTFDITNHSNWPVVYSGPMPSAGPRESAWVHQLTKDNERKEARIRRYMRIYDVDRLAMTSLEMTLRFFYQIAPQGMSSDIAALNDILDTFHITGDRRIEIISNYCMRPGPQQ